MSRRRKSPEVNKLMKLADGKPPRRIVKQDPALPGTPKPHHGLVTDSVRQQSVAEQAFHRSQVQTGWDLIRENKPADTAADLVNVNLARVEAGMFPDPKLNPEPKPDDPMAPVLPPDPMKPRG